jgi:beta-xylosidase
MPDLGGAIDPSCFIDDDGSRYLVWKNDGNSKGQDTWLWVQKLRADGLSLQGQPTRLLKQDQTWEGSLIEAPTLWKHGGKYYLFYSANGYGGCRYAIGYAVSDSLLGPYVKPRDVPFQASTGDVCGPGGEDIVPANDGRTWMAYHYWAKGPGSYRAMSIDPLVWDGDIPYLLGPSRWPQPAPTGKARTKG